MAELERTIEDKLIKQLTEEESQWTYCPELNTEDKLWANLRHILESNNRDRLDGTALSDSEFAQVKNQLSFPSFYRAAEWLVGENGRCYVHVQRGNEVLHLLVIDNTNITGGKSVYQLINQYQAFADDDDDTLKRSRRFDVTLLINGLPIIHIELKNRQHPYKDGFRQIVKYIKEDKFKGIFSTVQMFVVSNAVDTKYIASARYDELNEKFLSGWVDAKNQVVADLTGFANEVLHIPEAHQLIAQYTVLDKEKGRIILLRPYQIHAIQAIHQASTQGQSGYIWHTTGSGKTLTSYKVARNLLRDVPAIEKTVFLIDRKDLDQQTTSAFQSYAENDVVDVDPSENVRDLQTKLSDGSRQMIVTTRQKLQTLMKKLLKNRESKAYKKISMLKIAFVVDECHRAISPETKRSIEVFFHQSMWYGFTGTPRFAENAYPKQGDLPRTTAEMYGPCLHSYTVKEAIHDGAVLGFQVEHFGPKGLETNDKGDNINENMALYDTKEHMLSVIDYMLNKSYEKLGIQQGRGKTFEGILTVRSIPMAQKYYDLLQDVKAGKTNITIREDVRRIVPDFPKIAITYSVSENEEESTKNQDKMAKAMADYNAMFGTHFGMDQLEAYNANLTERMARKRKQYESRSEQLDIVIVVDRLLTGFDAPCLSTLFIDRQPMQLHSLIQAFSRTNRIFNTYKTYGQIMTFQSPGTFKNKVDEALKLFSQGGETDVLAPDWEKAEAWFRKIWEQVRKFAANPADIPGMSKKEKKEFVRIFQKFDAAYKQVKSFTNFLDVDVEKEYGLTEPLYDDYVANYLNALEDIKPEPDDPDDGLIDPIDLDYTLQSYGGETIDYEYIVALMEDFVSNDKPQQNPEQRAKQQEEITKYIDGIVTTNPKLGGLVQHLWHEALAHPEQYRDVGLMAILEQTKKKSIHDILQNLCDTWCLNIKAVTVAANSYHAGDTDIPFLKEVKDTADFSTYKEKNSNTSLKPYKYRNRLAEEFRKVLDEEIVPLRDNQVVHQAKETKLINGQYSATNVANLQVAEQPKSFQ